MHVSAAVATNLTGSQFDALPYEEGQRWELLDGDLVPVSSPTPAHQEIVFRILSAMKRYLAAKNGIASNDVEFGLAGDTRLRPDVWLLLETKAALLDRSRVPIPGSPDLAVEVISPGERTSESIRKVDLYFKHGTREVWQVYPETRQVVVYTDAGEIRRVQAEDILTTALLPDLDFHYRSSSRTCKRSSRLAW